MPLSQNANSDYASPLIELAESITRKQGFCYISTSIDTREKKFGPKYMSDYSVATCKL